MDLYVNPDNWREEGSLVDLVGREVGNPVYTSNSGGFGWGGQSGQVSLLEVYFLIFNL